MLTFNLPFLGIGMDEAQVVRWRVKPGDLVKIDQPLLEVVNEKALLEIPSPLAGVVVSLNVAEGEAVRVGDPLLVFDTKPTLARAEVPVARFISRAENAEISLPQVARSEKAVVTVRKRELESEEVPFMMGRLEELNQLIESSSPHRHSFYQLFWIIQGTGLHHIDFNEYPIQPGTLFFLSPGMVHLMQPYTELVGFTYLFMADFLVLESMGQPLLRSLPFFRPDNQNPLLILGEAGSEQFMQINWLLEREYNTRQLSRPDMLKAYMFILLTTASRIKLEQSIEPVLPLQPLTQSFVGLVEKHFRQKKQVYEYAELLGVTPAYLNALVRKDLDKTAGEVIRDVILLEAKRMLLHTEYSVVEIAEHLNFEDPSYFSRFFRRYLNQAPSEFRENIRKKYQLSL